MKYHCLALAIGFDHDLSDVQAVPRRAFEIKTQFQKKQPLPWANPLVLAPQSFRGRRLKQFIVGRFAF